VAEEAAPEPATSRVATLPHHGVIPAMPIVPLNQVTMKQTLIQHTMKV